MAQRKYGRRVAGLILKGAGLLLALSIVGFFTWRTIDRNIVPSAVKTITPNEILSEAYEENGGKLTMFYQDQTDYSREEKNYGYFANAGSVFIDEAEQLQFILRYNNSTLKYTSEDYSYYTVTDKEGNSETFKKRDDALAAAKKIYSSEPEKHVKYYAPTLERDDNVFDVTVSIMYDLTPENKDDNDGKIKDAVEYVRFFPTGDAISYKKTLYNYRKFIFDGIKVDESVLAVMIDIYYVGDIDYESEPMATLLLYFDEDKGSNIEYKLSSADKKAIESYEKKTVED